MQQPAWPLSDVRSNESCAVAEESPADADVLVLPAGLSLEDIAAEVFCTTDERSGSGWPEPEALAAGSNIISYGETKKQELLLHVTSTSQAHHGEDVGTTRVDRAAKKHANKERPFHADLTQRLSEIVSKLEKPQRGKRKEKGSFVRTVSRQLQTSSSSIEDCQLQYCRHVASASDSNGNGNGERASSSCQELDLVKDRQGLCPPSMPSSAGPSGLANVCWDFPELTRHLQPPFATVAGDVVDSVRQRRLQNQLVALAEAMSLNDKAKTNYFLRSLPHEATPDGDSAQRGAFFVLKGLEARLEGKGRQRFQEPIDVSVQEFVSSLDQFRDVPYLQFGYALASSMLKEKLPQDNKKVHVLVMGPYTEQLWEDLMLLLSSQASGVPVLRVTAIDFDALRWSSFPRGLGPILETLLMRMAAKHGVHVQFESIFASTESFYPQLIEVDPAYSFIVLSFWSMMFLPEESILRSSPRNRFLQWIREQEPLVVILMEVDANSTGPFFISRVKEAAQAATSLFATLAHKLPRVSRARELFEQNLAKNIMSVVACEGLDRMVRAERLEVWQDRMQRLGFLPVDISDIALRAIGQVCREDTNLSITKLNMGLRLLWQGNPFISGSCWK